MIRYTDIISANYIKGTLNLLAKIEIITPGTSKIIENITPDEAQRFTKIVNRKISLAKQSPSPSSITEQIPYHIPIPEKSVSEDPFEKIKKAKELLDIGAITDNEFQDIKDKCLKKIIN